MRTELSGFAAGAIPGVPLGLLVSYHPDIRTYLFMAIAAICLLYASYLFHLEHGEAEVELRVRAHFANKEDS